MKIAGVTLIIAALYFLTVTYLMNSRLAIDTLLGNYPLTYKTSVFGNLVTGMWSAMGTLGTLLLLTLAILTGANIALLFQRIITISGIGGAHLVAGGSSLLGIAASGCAACGLPILSLMGISASLVFLPFRGQELTYLAIILLTVSLITLVKTKPALNCRVKK